MSGCPSLLNFARNKQLACAAVHKEIRREKNSPVSDTINNEEIIGRRGIVYKLLATLPSSLVLVSSRIYFLLYINYKLLLVV